MTTLTHKLARGHPNQLRAARLRSALLCSSFVARLPSRLASATHGAKLLFPKPPHSLAISNGRRWGSDGPVQRTGACAGSAQRSRETHSAVNARGSTGPSSVVGRTSAFDPALWEDGVLRELPAGAPTSNSRQSAPSPSGPSSGRSGFGARLMDMNGDSTPLLSAQHAVALQLVLHLSAQGACAGACESSTVV